MFTYNMVLAFFYKQSSPTFCPVLDLEGAVQTYAWGKQGLSSKVAQLARAYKGVTIDDNEYYAEVCPGKVWVIYAWRLSQTVILQGNGH